jgi:hypothetical protein
VDKDKIYLLLIRSIPFCGLIMSVIVIDQIPFCGLCYKQNLSVGTDPTYPAVKPVTASLIARHEAETTRTSGGPSPEAVKKGKKKGERLARSRSQDHPPWVLSFLSFLDGQNGLGGENYGQWDENELADF